MIKRMTALDITWNDIESKTPISTKKINTNLLQKKSYWLQPMQSCIHWCKIRFFQKECQFIILLEMLWSRFCVSLLANQPACHCWDGQTEEERCPTLPFQPHICIFQLLFTLLPHHSYYCFSFSGEVSSTQKTTMRFILLQKATRDVYYGESVQKILMRVTAHLPHYCRFNWIQYPALPGQLSISKGAKSANKTGHKGHVSNPQAEDHKLNDHTAHFLHSCQNNPGAAQTLGSFEKSAYLVIKLSGSTWYFQGFFPHPLPFWFIFFAALIIQRPC